MEKDEYRRIAESEERHWWYVGMRNLMTSLTADLIPASGGRFLDAGCGPGGNGLWMSAHGNVYGIDIMTEALEFASENHPSLELAQATVEALPFADNSFDALQSITILTHEGVRAETNALDEYRRVLKPGGIALVVEPAFPVLRREHDRVVHAIRRYRLGELANLCRGSGFEIVRTTYAYSFLFPVALALACIDRLRIRARSSPAHRDRSDLERGGSGSRFMTRLCEAEARYLRQRGRRIPIGVSAVVVARKPG